VILVDANLLVYAVREEAREHEQARAWLDACLSGTQRVGLPWPALLAFVRLTANSAIMTRPLALADAFAIVSDWLAQPPAWIPHPTARHADLLGSLLEREHGHRIVPDAHLAALAIENGLILCTADRGFARFPGLRWENPLDA
jgi:toxin-antitoxin system PIN domain toxin